MAGGTEDSADAAGGRDGPKGGGKNGGREAGGAHFFRVDFGLEPEVAGHAQSGHDEQRERGGQEAQGEQKSAGQTGTHAPRGTHGGGAAQGNQQAHYAVDDEESGQQNTGKEGEAGKAPSWLATPREFLAPQLDFLLQLVEEGFIVAAYRLHQAGNQKIARRLRGGEEAGDKIARALMLPLGTTQGGRVDESAVGLRRRRSPFLKRRSSVVITVV